MLFATRWWSWSCLLVHPGFQLSCPETPLIWICNFNVTVTSKWTHLWLSLQKTLKSKERQTRQRWSGENPNMKSRLLKCHWKWKHLDILIIQHVSWNILWSVFNWFWAWTFLLFHKTLHTCDWFIIYMRVINQWYTSNLSHYSLCNIQVCCFRSKILLCHNDCFQIAWTAKDELKHSDERLVAVASSLVHN